MDSIVLTAFQCVVIALVEYDTVKEGVNWKEDYCNIKALSKYKLKTWLGTLGTSNAYTSCSCKTCLRLRYKMTMTEWMRMIQQPVMREINSLCSQTSYSLCKIMVPLGYLGRKELSAW